MKITSVRGANSEIDGRSLSEYVLFQQFVFYNIYNQGSLSIARTLITLSHHQVTFDGRALEVGINMLLL